jgi:hypothetical protein
MVSRIQLPDDSSLRANHYETKSLATSEAPLEKIFIFTPVPTIVLDSSLRICQVSDSHLSLTQLSRGDIVGCSMFDVPLSIHYTCLQSSCSSWSCTDRRQYEDCAANRPTVGKPVPEIDTHFRGIQFYTPRHRSHSIASRESPRAWIGFVVVLCLLSGYYFGATIWVGGHTLGANG